MTLFQCNDAVLLRVQRFTDAPMHRIIAVYDMQIVLSLTVSIVVIHVLSLVAKRANSNLLHWHQSV